jgi:PAS domain S-box-containing protein
MPKTKTNFTKPDHQLSEMELILNQNKRLSKIVESLKSKLSELKNTIRLVSDTCPDLLWVKDLDNRYLFVNKAICDNLLSANDTNEPLGKDDLYFAKRQRESQPDKPEYHTFGELCVDSDEIVKQTKKPGRFEEFGNVKGRFTYLKVHKAPIINSENNIVGTVGSGRILTFEKEIERALQESETKYRTLAYNISDIIIRFSTDNKITFANKIIKPIYNYYRTSIINLHINDVGFDDEFKGFCLKNLNDVKQQYKQITEICSIKNNRENISYFECTFTPEYNEQNTLFSILFIAHNITESVRARQLQKLEEIRLNAILKLNKMQLSNINKLYNFSLEQALKLTNSKYGYLGSLNEKKDKIILHALSEEIKQTFPTPHKLPKEIEILDSSICQKVLNSNKPLIINKFNKPFPLKLCFSGWQHSISRIMIIPVNVEENTTSLLMVSDKDTNYSKADFRQVYLLMEGFKHNIRQRNNLRELKMAKQKAEESDHLKSAFLANMSHEIRTPMNGIIGFASLLARADLPEDKRKKYVNIINSSTHQLLNIISDIVDISKIEAGQMNINKEDCEIKHLFNQLEQHFKLELKNKQKTDVTIKAQIQNNSIKSVYTDSLRLNQIFSNLINNAIKFTEKGTITFGYYPSYNKTITFFVKDTGIGIPPDQQKIIFERFRQVDGKIARKYGGTGLGLSISKGIIELLGGRIWLESKIGKGTTFNFTIPII